MINLAYNMALKSPSKFRLGAVLCRNKRVISTGYNQMNKSHPRMQKFCDKNIILGLHAEVHACLGVPITDLQGAYLWVCRIYRNGSIALAKPCRTCEKFLINVGIKRVYYSTETDVKCIYL